MVFSKPRWCIRKRVEELSESEPTIEIVFLFRDRKREGNKAKSDLPW